MPLPIIAVLGRAALSSVAKKTAARALTSREISIAKNRYVRASKRYADEALSVGERTRYGQLLKKASNRLGHLSEKLTDIDHVRSDARSVDLVSESGRYLVKATRSKMGRGDLLGETLLNGTMQGHRLFSVTQSIWEDVGYENRYAAIKEAFGDRSLSEVILEIEERTGVNIMKGDINSEERYGTLSRAERMKVEQFIIENYG